MIRITMENAGDSFEVLLHDPKKPKPKVEIRTGIQPAPELKPAQPAPATPPAVETAKPESNEKQAEPSQKMGVAAAPPSPGRAPSNYLTGREVKAVCGNEPRRFDVAKFRCGGQCDWSSMSHLIRENRDPNNGRPSALNLLSCKQVGPVPRTGRIQSRPSGLWYPAWAERR